MTHEKANQIATDVASGSEDLSVHLFHEVTAHSSSYPNKLTELMAIVRGLLLAREKEKDYRQEQCGH